MLVELRDGRELLRNSYILAYFLSWDERRRWALQMSALYAAAHHAMPVNPRAP